MNEERPAMKKQQLWGVLLCTALLCTGTNYIYDFPGVLGVGENNTIQARFEEEGVKYTQAMNQGLYAVYSFPNTVLVVVGGVLTDRVLGLRAATVVFSIVTIAGASLFFGGVYFRKYWLIATGRLLLGCSCECLGIAQSAWNTRWFAGRKAGLALAFGLAQALQRSGAALNFAFSTRIARAHGVCVAVAVGIAAAGLSLLASIVVLSIDAWGVRRGHVPPHVPIAETEQGDAEEGKVQAGVDEGGKSGEGEEPQKMPLCRTLALPPLAFVLGLFCALSYDSMLTFIGYAQSFLEQQYGMSQVHASTVLTYYQLCAALGAPLVGALADVTGRLSAWHSLSALMTATALVLLRFFPHAMPAEIPVCLLGIAFASLVATFWASVPLAIPDKRQLATGFGVITAGIASTTASLRIVFGVILDTGAGDDAPLPSLDSFHTALNINVGCSFGAIAISFLAGAMAFRTDSKIFASKRVPPSAAEEKAPLID